MRVILRGNSASLPNGPIGSGCPSFLLSRQLATVLVCTAASGVGYCPIGE
jgi:hypothetical protein